MFTKDNVVYRDIMLHNIKRITQKEFLPKCIIINGNMKKKRTKQTNKQKNKLG